MARSVVKVAFCRTLSKYRRRELVSINLLDVVVLSDDLPEYNLVRGQAGTVVEILVDGEAFEVEFTTPDGRTLESVGLRPDQLMVRSHVRAKTSSAPATPRSGANGIQRTETP